ncbi:hypothetical protein L6452_40441 [Arctium lappa]|uniref:Uncharacterized protein n=1 Tax=Arctium lappa TaxID=4217 RepID=A0ACB8XR24_ARCLA|nr:hypothetical protein L6452_40441 [Arctium lappa]
MRACLDSLKFVDSKRMTMTTMKFLTNYFIGAKIKDKIIGYRIPMWCPEEGFHQDKMKWEKSEYVQQRGRCSDGRGAVHKEKGVAGMVFVSKKILGFVGVDAGMKQR